MRRKVPRMWIFAAALFSALFPAADQTKGSLALIEARQLPRLVEQTAPKLSAALRAIIEAEGIVKGADESGRIIVSASDTKFTALKNSRAVQYFSTHIPSPINWEPVKQLKLSYDLSNKPSAEDLNKLGLRLIEDYEKGSFMIVEPLNNQIDSHLAQAIQAEPHISYATLALSVRAIPPSNSIRATHANKTVPRGPNQPNDPMFPELWGMQSIRAPAAWQKIHDSDVIVAVIDTGVDYNHEDLRDNMWTDKNGKHGYNFFDNNDNPMDVSGHGTHCAGTIGAKGNNSIGVVGVNWKVKIMAVRWLDARGSGNVANAIKAIDFAIDHGAKILSCSWFWIEDDPNLEAAIKRASKANVLFVAAAGNNGGDNDQVSTPERFPSAYPLDNIIAVAAIDDAEKLASFSDFGKRTVHLGAPGVAIKSTLPRNKYDGDSGTSMATPHVAGAAALIMAIEPTSGAIQVKDEILKHVRKIASLRNRCVTGGTLDLSFLGQGQSSITKQAVTYPTK